MRWARGPRPWPVWLFAAAFGAAAVLRLVTGLGDLVRAQMGWIIRFPALPWDRDWTIVALSAEFTIALIPIVWIFGFANRYARWLVLGFGAIKLIGLRGLPVTGDDAYPSYLVEPALVVIAICALLTPAAGRWLAPKKELDPALFS
jgi:hypothetical protein